MTQEQLDAIPEFQRISHIDEVRDGKLVRIPVINGCEAIYHSENDPAVVVDANGVHWGFVGVNGIKHKVRI